MYICIYTNTKTQSFELLRKHKKTVGVFIGEILVAVVTLFIGLLLLGEEIYIILEKCSNKKKSHSMTDRILF
jgi:hypothetical protein